RFTRCGRLTRRTTEIATDERLFAASRFPSSGAFVISRPRRRRSADRARGPSSPTRSPYARESATTDRNAAEDRAPRRAGWRSGIRARPPRRVLSWRHTLDIVAHHLRAVRVAR